MMKRRPQILITNDDGIDAPGIRHLWNALQGKADLFIVAPSDEQSGVGAGISLHTPLKVQEIEWSKCTGAWSVSGTPVDCVKMAINVLLKTGPDLIVSGINRGTNAGRNVLYSGTVGGVIEGTLRGIPGVAFSAYDYNGTNYAIFEEYIPQIVNYMMKHPLPAGTFLNVNFPSVYPENRKDGLDTTFGIKLTRQGKQYWLEHPEKIIYHKESSSYEFVTDLKAFDEHEDSDIHWLELGYITAVPVHVEELTDRKYLKEQKNHFEKYVHSVDKIDLL
jgi:5'-nucleotidase